MSATFEKVRTLGTIGHWGKSTVEVNIGSWNGGKPKIDIRAWSDESDTCSKGIRLTDKEAKELMKVLQDYFKEA